METKIQIATMQLKTWDDDVAGRRKAILGQLEQLGNEASQESFARENDKFLADRIRGSLQRIENAAQDLEKAVTRRDAVRDLLTFLETEAN